MPEARATAWLSQGLESLERRLGQAPRAQHDFDVVIVGSGYGGAVAAAELAGCSVDDGAGGRRPVSLCILERGREYLGGAFPSRFSELPGHVRIAMPGAAQPAGPRDGLFDLRAGADVAAVVANGLGGGSLINAGVMAEPRPGGFGREWPAAIRDDAGLPSLYARARRLLGAEDEHGLNTMSRHAHGTPPKLAMLHRLAAGTEGAACSEAPLTIAMRDGPNQAGVHLQACKRCGDCATGCNHGAKNSLDTNLLAQARQRGAQLYTGATVLRIAPLRGPADGWTLEVVHTGAALRRKQPAPLRLNARRVILAAGTFGSTEILLRSRSDALRLSNLLGHGFSANGDLIVAGHAQAVEVNAVADESCPPDRRGIGPTITGMLDTRGGGGYLVEEMAVPGPLRRVFEEMVTTAASLHSLAAPGMETDADPHAVDAGAMRRTALYAVMGDDGAHGVMELEPGADGDGGLRVRWPGLRDDRLYGAQMQALREMAARSGVGGTMLPPPLWQPLPEQMDGILGVGKGPPLTVHPLGGCAMGEDCASGVVNHLGQVWERGSGKVHEGLAVLDGAIVPCALGVNPALTIAALALRAVDGLRGAWGMEAAPAAPRPAAVRPLFKEAATPAPAAPTEVQLLERLSGRVLLRGADGRPTERIVELTLMFRPLPVTRLAGENAVLEIARGEEASSGRIRIFAPEAWETLAGRRPGTGGGDLPDPVPDELLDEAAEFIAPLSGTLRAFVRERNKQRGDTLRALAAWLANRGVRDAWQELSERLRLVVRGEGGDREALDLLARARASLALASHARHARRLEYGFTLGAPEKLTPQAHYAAVLLPGATIAGHKRLAYLRRANPWRQLSEMRLDSMPGLEAGAAPGARPGAGPLLRLDTRFLASRQWPLLRIVRQQDQATALADVGSLLAFVLRMLATIHAWSFRKPDAAPPRPARRLPGKLPGLPAPEIHEFQVGRMPGGEPVRIRLTRYRRPGQAGTPLLMIHGYSTSGTTFAHHAVQPNLAGYFAGQGRDVWVLDMRTSAGMPSARHGWRFEDAAFADIPAAVNFIHGEVNRAPGAAAQKIDILAHCMGAAMLGMAVLKPPHPREPYYRERCALPDRIGRVLLSQVGPAVVFTPDNVLRAWLMRYVRHLLPRLDYQFNPDAASPAGDLLDRLLSTLPYPDEEFDLENPPWWQFARRTPYTRIRHRMDALYGRDFSLKNLAPRTLRQMDDLFGPLSLQTVSQAMHFARFRTITTHRGVNDFVTRDNIRERWRFPTMSVHGVENGLADVATLERMRRVFADAGRTVETRAVPGYGHQDCLIGRHAQRDVFVHMEAFLAREEQPEPARAEHDVAPQAAEPLTLCVPWVGPLLGTPDAQGAWPVRAELHPVYGIASHVVRIAVRRSGAGLVLASEGELGDPPSVQAEEMEASMARQRRYRGLIDPAPWQGRADAMLLLFLYRQPPLYAPGYDKSLGHLQPRIEEAARGLLAQESPDELEKALVEWPRGSSRDTRARQAAGGLCFALASCQYPAGVFDRLPAYASYRRLARLLRQDDGARPSMLLLLGDQIYADATAGLFDPLQADDRYRAPYETLLHHPDVRAVFRSIPVHAMLDDHEIEDNWERRQGDRAGRRMLRRGRAGYLRYLRQAPLQKDDPLWYSFTRQGIPFFMLDTRSERSGRTAADVDSARIIGEAQFEALTTWLLAQRDAPGPKFIASPSILLPRLRRAQHDAPASALHSDAWDGYPASLHALLAWIADHEIHDLVFLSGDEHLSCDATATITGPGGRGVRIRSIHSSALYAPWPFANAAPADLAAEEEFGFAVAGKGGYRCSVSTRFAPPGDGFALLQVVPDGAGWRLECGWNREAGGPAQAAAQPLPGAREPA